MMLCIWPVWELRDAVRRVHLRPQEGLIVLALLGRREIDQESLMDVLWPDPDLMPDTWSRGLHVRFSALRIKLRPFGWTIACRTGFGWRLKEAPMIEGIIA